MKNFVRTVGTVIALLACVGTVVEAQTDPCQSATPPFVVTSGRPFTAVWLMDAMVQANPPTDPTLVPARIDGFYLQIDSQPRVDTGPIAPSAPCPVGTPNAGKLPFSWTSSVGGVSRGTHTFTVRGWNFQLDTQGVPTTTRQEGVVASIPFSAVDLVQVGAPLAPTNAIIRR